MKKITLFPLIILFLIFTQGCVHRLYTYPEFEAGLNKSYGIDKEVTATTGSPMIQISRILIRPAYRPRYTYLPPNAGVIRAIELNPSQLWIVRGKRDRSAAINIYLPEWSWKITLDIFRDGTITDQPWKNDTGNGDVTMVQGEWNPPDKRLFEKVEGIPDKDPNLDNFQAELIYNGISKNTIRVTYREFIKDMARPAFYQDLTYDLDQSAIIQFKSLRIRIMAANNSLIKFLVLDDEGLPWIPKK